MENKEINTTKEYVDKMFKYMKHNSSAENYMQKFNLNLNELRGLIELCNIYGKNVSLSMQDGTLVFNKPLYKNKDLTKPSINSDKLTHTELCIVSDTHFGNNRQQLHLLNKIYEEAYNRDIKTVLHCGDVVDGNYPNRPENPRLQFLHGFDEQANYVAEMYPKVNGIKTKYILGSHDESHYKNGQATINNFLFDRRKDMEYLGQDSGEIDINNIKIIMDHPGGGSSQSVSYKPQKRIEILESGNKPKILLIGHYHKSYYFVYRNVRCIEVPALCDKTQFQAKQGLLNAVGAYFLDIYSDSKGDIVYFKPEEILFNHTDMWDESGKDKKRVKKLEIK